MAETITILLNTQAAGAGVAATVNGLQRVKGAADAVSTRLASLGRSLIAGLVPAVTLSGLGRMMQQTLANADALGDLAQKAGGAVREISALAEVGRIHGIGQEQWVASTKTLTGWLEKHGQTGKDLTQVILEQADVFQRMPDSMEKTRLATEMFGRSGAALIPMLNEGTEKLREQMAEAEQLGLVIGPRFAKDAGTFNDNLTRIWGVFRGIANIVAAALVPALIEMQEAFIEWVKDGDKTLSFADAIIGKFTTLAQIANATNTTVGVLFAALPAYLGALSGGAGLKEAGDIASAQLKEITDAYAKRKEMIDKIARRPDAGEAGGGGGAQGTRMTDLQSWRLEMEKNSLKIAQLKAMANVSEFERALALKKELKDRLIILENIAEIEKDSVPSGQRFLGKFPNAEETAEYAEAVARANQSLAELAQTEAELFNLDQDDFFERMSEGIRNLTEEFDNLAGSIADTLIDGIGSAIDTVADGIWQVIDGTATWGELFQNVARNIISDLIRIALQEVILDTLKKGLLTAWTAMKAAFVEKDVAVTNAGEAAKMPALAATATMASVSSWGLAAIIGVAAIAAILASVGAFQEGGVVSGGEQLIRVNERGQEAVLNANATAMLGASGIAALNAGSMEAITQQAAAGAMGGSGSGDSRQPLQVNVAVFDSRDKDRMAEWAATSRGKAVFVDIAANNKTEIGIA